ncbi:PREDICTED: zinc finger CCCH domain-containing protein 13 isoform X2 [Dinoponera quadriceps]|uniref:Zinc finger CCCH domain-containing protein 13 isoform X2 n=1 Tax=Dinoponera quadriceps TaxID=609295 RepID=A0A6P3WML9_DINQU|nr:PREDICTED: zinc finger CCCH domain-containing protein 13 isoform X2 [Dinoponera quadriceps]
MTSRLRGPSAVKDTPRAVPFAKEHFHREPEAHSGRPCKNGGRGGRYHFGMSKHDSKAERNGRECGKGDTGEEEESAEVVYRKSKQQFAAWQIKDIVQQDDGGAKRSSRRQEQEDSSLRQLTNGKFRSEPAKPDKQDRLEYRDEGYVGSLPREDRQRGESAERELNGSHRSKRKEQPPSWEEAAESRGRGRSSKVIGKSGDNKDCLAQPVDERDILLKEIENLAVDGSQSPDRRIQAMIERLKSREESKLRCRREQRSASPEKEARGRTRSDVRAESRPLVDHALDYRSNERKRPKDDREDERRLHGRPEEDVGRPADQRSRSAERQHNEVLFSDKERESRKDDSFRKRSDTYSADRPHRRRSREDEEGEQPRARDGSKRRSYTYEGPPEDFDVRIQRYERAVLEPRRDLDTSRRSSPKEPVSRESLKEHDREPVGKKNSFRAESKRAGNKDRESSLTRRTSFKDQDNDGYKRHLSKSPLETSVRSTYFGKEQEEPCRKDSFKDTSVETGRKTFLKTQDNIFERTYLKDSPHDDVERKAPPKEHSAGVSRIVLRNFDDESVRSNSFRNTHEDAGRRNSFKEKSLEFGGISHKDRASDSEKRNSFREEDEEGSPGRTLYHDYENNIDRKTANERYIEFGKVSFKMQEDELGASPFKEKDSATAAIRTSSFKERDSSAKRRVSLRGREASERKSDRHSRPLTPPGRQDETHVESHEDDGKEPRGFKSWHESNRLFSAKYLREHSKLRGAPEGRVSPERGLAILPDPRTEALANDPTEEQREDRFGTRGEPADESPRFSSTSGATIIRIRSSEEPAERSRRRRRVEVCAVRRRRAYEDEEDSDEEEAAEEKDRRRWALPGRNAAGDATPSRTMWNYREGGVLITDVEEGQPCLQCREMCPGFSPHAWRKNCTSCKCPREAHDVCHEEWVSVRSRLGLKGDESSGPIGVDPRERGLAWVPPGLQSHRVEEYFSMLPEIAVPRLGAPGERHRDRQLAIQLPKQDLARAYCRHLDPKHAGSADDFMAARNEIALDIGSVQEVVEKSAECGVCQKSLKYGSLAVSASKLGLFYHPACFRCADCKELLVDLAYCVHDDTLFCERHYAEQLKPRCAACDERRIMHTHGILLSWEEFLKRKSGA